MYLCECMCITCGPGARGVQRGWDSLELELRVEVPCLMSVLETEPGPLDEQKGLSHRAISPTPTCFKLNLRQLSSYTVVVCVAFSWLAWQVVAFSLRQLFWVELLNLPSIPGKRWKKTKLTWLGMIIWPHQEYRGLKWNHRGSSRYLGSSSKN